MADAGSIVATRQGKITVNQSSEQALSLTKDALATTFAAISQSNDTARDIANRAVNTNQSPTENVIEQFVPVAIVGLIAWAVIA